MEPRRVPLGDDGFFIIMPGTWASIPLSSQEAITRRVSALVKQQVGTNDRLASRRRQFRDELISSATSAAAEGAIAFSIALELLPGVPFSGAMLTHRVEWPPVPALIRDLADVRARLVAAFPDATILDTEIGPIARVATPGEQRFVDQKTPSLRLEYWVPAPQGDSLLDVLVSLPMVGDPDLFTELFDSIMDSLTWVPSPLPDFAPSDVAVSS